MGPRIRVDPSKKAFPSVKHKRSFNSNGGGSACDKEKAPLTDNSILCAWRCVLIQKEKPSSALCCWVGYCTRVDERVMIEIPLVRKEDEEENLKLIFRAGLSHWPATKLWLEVGISIGSKTSAHN